MKLSYALVCLSSLALAACSSADSQELIDDDDQAAEQAGPGASTDARDPLGVDLVSVGLSAGDRPCGQDAHVASVVDTAGRYLAFCANASGNTSVFQVTPGAVSPLGAAGGCALDTYLAATPESAAVPQALVASCRGAKAPSRTISAEPVAVIAPASPLALAADVIIALGPCESATLFTNIYCGAIEDFASGNSIADAETWCRVGPFEGTAQRTASTQGMPDAFQGRQTVAACGTGTTNLKGFVKGGLTGTWKVPSGASVNISPRHVATRDVYLFDVFESDGFDDYFGSDLRFTVTPSADAWYRYAGTFVEFVPVP